MRIVTATNEQAGMWCPIINEPFLHIEIVQGRKCKIGRYKNTKLIKKENLRMSNSKPKFNTNQIAFLKKALSQFNGKLIVVSGDVQQDARMAVAAALLHFYSPRSQKFPKKYDQQVYQDIINHLLKNRGSFALNKKKKMIANPISKIYKQAA